MPGLVGRLRTAVRERDELVSQVDERHPTAAPAHFERAEDRLPERECLLEIADLERDVVDPHELWHCASSVPLGRQITL